RIVQIDTAEQILANPADEYVSKFIADVDRSRVITAGALMRRPRGVLQLGSGPRVALRELENEQLKAGYVINRQRQLQGTVHATDLLEARNREDTDLRNLIRPDHTSVSPSTPLSELFGQAADAKLPLAVIDTDGRLLGVVPQVRILEAMAHPNGNGPERSPASQQPEPQASTQSDVPDPQDTTAATSEGAQA